MTGTQASYPLDGRASSTLTPKLTIEVRAVAHLEESVTAVEVGAGPEAEHLPEHDPKAPDITGKGILVLGQTLQRQPLDRNVGVAAHDVDVLVDRAGQAEVADLHQLLIGHQDVAGGQVPRETQSSDQIIIITIIIYLFIYLS